MRLFVAAFAAATFALQCAPSLPTWPVAALGVALLLACRFLRGTHVIARVAAALVVGAVLGYGYAAWRAEVRRAEELPRAWEGRDVEIVGLVASLPQVTSRGTR